MYACVSGGGVIKSTNSGTTWNPTNATNPGSYTGIACNSTGQIVYVAWLGQGLYGSTNGGTTWSVIISEGTLPGGSANPETTTPFGGYSFSNIDTIACDATGTKLIMTTNAAASIYLSNNSGVSFTFAYVIPGYSATPNAATLVASNSDASILFYASQTAADKRIYTSIDNGVNWSVVTSPGIPTSFSSIATNYTGDFIYAINNYVYIFYTSYAVVGQLALPPFTIPLRTALYNNGNNAMIMITDSSLNTYYINNLYAPACFKEDTNILCFEDGSEVYTKIQDIRKGTLVKTSLNGYVPVNMIGSTKVYNSGDELRGQNKLYRCSKEKYPELYEDLIITGGHAILVDEFKEGEKEATLEIYGKVYITDNKYRLPACVDIRTLPYEEEGLFNVYHIALDNDEYYWNYGIYANGLLVEACSKRYLKELSGMKLL